MFNLDLIAYFHAIAACALTLVLATPPGTLADGGTSYPRSHKAVEPFPGSEFISYSDSMTVLLVDPAYRAYTYPVHQLLVRPAEHYGGIEKNTESAEAISGLVTSMTFRSPASLNTQTVMDFHEKKLTTAGFTPIFECRMEACGGRKFTHAVVDVWNYGKIGESADFRYLAMRREDTYVELYVALANVRSGRLDQDRVLVQATVVERRADDEPPPDDDVAESPGDDGRGVIVVKTKDGEEILLYEKSYALLIGVSDYLHWPDLAGVRDDLRAVEAALTRQGFAVESVIDPDQRALEEAFEDFIARHGRDPKNRLLFYFAGHGHTHKPAYAKDDPEEWRGFIVSRDSPLPDDDYNAFRRNAMSMQRFEELAKDIEASHALFLLDSCFSGTLIAATREPPADIRKRVARPVRQFITSGSADEAVPDASIFRRQFIEGLNGDADFTGDGYVTGTELGEFLKSKVTNYSNGSQTPRYGKLRDPNLDKGDFVFVVREPAGD